MPRACGSTDGAELSNNTHGKSNEASKAIDGDCAEGLDDQVSVHNDSPVDVDVDMKFIDDGSQQLFL
jgi:hypothetical protein